MLMKDEVIFSDEGARVIAHALAAETSTFHDDRTIFLLIAK